MGLMITHAFADARGVCVGFVAENSAECYVVFRGTDNCAGWLSDVDAHQVPLGVLPGKVHAGFAEALLPMLGEILGPLPTNKPITITGHSLGAAEALLLSHFQRCEAVYTFGCPRVGNRELAAATTWPVYRVVNQNDAIAHLPAPLTVLHLRPWIYQHAGQLEYLTGDGRIVEDASAWQRAKCQIADFLGHVGDLSELCGPVSHHFINRYITALAAAQ